MEGWGGGGGGTLEPKALSLSLSFQARSRLTEGGGEGLPLSRNSCLQQAWDRESLNFHTGRERRDASLLFSSLLFSSSSNFHLLVGSVFFFCVLAGTAVCDDVPDRVGGGGGGGGGGDGGVAVLSPTVACSKYVTAVITSPPSELSFGDVSIGLHTYLFLLAQAIWYIDSTCLYGIGERH